MGFFAAIVPSFVYRTMAGFFEEDALGFLWLVLGLIFFVRSLKQNELNKIAIKNGLIAWNIAVGMIQWKKCLSTFRSINKVKDRKVCIYNDQNTMEKIIKMIRAQSFLR